MSIAVAVAAVLSSVVIGSSGAYFTGQTSSSAQSARAAALTPVTSVTAARAGDTAGQSTRVSWSSATEQPWAVANASAGVTYTVKRSTTQDFSTAPTVYTGPDRAFTDSTGSKPLGSREVTNVVGTQRQDGYYALIGGSVYLWGRIQRAETSETYLNLPSNTPVAVAGPAEPITQLAAGRDHACALTQSAQVYCVGFNTLGQLGSGNTGATVTLTAITDPNGVFTGKVIKSIDAGEYYTCALTTDGTVGCWGDNSHGQLGVAKSTTSSAVPVKVVDGNGAFTTFRPSLLTTGAYHACVVKGSNTSADGAVTKPLPGETVACWGWNNWRQLGSAVAQDSGSTAGVPTPTNIPDPGGVLVNVTAINAGHAVTCVVNDAATSPNVGCWGGGGLGVLGDGGTGETPTPTKIGGSATGFTGVDVGTTHACAIKDVTFSCWGQNNLGQLGRGVTAANGASQAVVAPISLATLLGDDPIVSVATAWTTTCLSSARGALICFGNGQQSQILGRTGIQNAPVNAITGGAGLRPTETATSVASGNDGYIAVAVINGVTTYFGKNFGTVVFSQANAPTAVAGVPEGARQVTAGERHGCALVGDNEIWCFGSNSDLQLGNGTANSMTALRVQDPDGVLTGKVVKKIDAGAAFTCALTTDGTIGCWGYNTNNQVTATSTADQGKIVRYANASGDPYPAFSGTGNQAVDLAAGGYSVCVARQAAAPVCWGLNDLGQLGNGTTTGSSSPIPVSGSALSAGVRAIDGGWKTSCALTTSGSAYCWGRAAWGETGTQLRDGSAVRTPTAINSASTFDSISVGTRVGCAYSGSSVTCWGDNDYGELGRGNDGAPDTALAPGLAADPGNVFAGGISSISVGWQTTCVITTAKALSCWGRNDNGQAGQGAASTMVTSPTLVQRAGLTVSGSSQSCLDGATRVDDFTCSLSPNRAYYYQVTYRVAGADRWASQERVAARP